jgi:hypothetical protein
VLVAVMQRPADVAGAEVASMARRAVDDRHARAALSGALRHFRRRCAAAAVGADVECELRLLVG